MSSGLEIERKFLVKKGGNYRDAAFNCVHIKQGYIPAEGATVRIRLRGDKAFLTIKSRSTDNGLSRYEFEKEISVDEAAHLMMLCKGGVIDKHRYSVMAAIRSRWMSSMATMKGSLWPKWNCKTPKNLTRNPTSSAWK